MIGHFSIYPLDNLYAPITLLSPQGIAMDITGNRLAVVENDFTVAGNNIVKIFNATTYALITSVTLTLISVALEYDNINNRFIVGYDSISSGRIFTVISGVDYSVTHKNDSDVTEWVVRAIKFDHANDRMFLTCFRAETNAQVRIYKISDLSFITSFLCQRACGLELDIINNKIYVACQSDAVLRVFNATTYALIETITLTGMSEAYQIITDYSDPDLSIISDRVSNKMMVFKKSTKTLLKQHGGVGVRFLVFKNSTELATTTSPNKISIIKKF